MKFVSFFSATLLLCASSFAQVNALRFKLAVGAEPVFRCRDDSDITLKDSQRPSWAWGPNLGSDNLLNVSAHHFIDIIPTHESLKFTQATGRETVPSNELAKNQSVDRIALLGVWIFPEAAPGISPVVLELKSNSSFTLEVEGAVTDSGRWELSGDKITLHSKEQGDIVASVKLKSKKQLLWSANGRRTLVLTKG